jgi:hypothetical protein
VRRSSPSEAQDLRAGLRRLQTCRKLPPVTRERHENKAIQPDKSPHTSRRRAPVRPPPVDALPQHRLSRAEVSRATPSSAFGQGNRPRSMTL